MYPMKPTLKAMPLRGQKVSSFSWPNCVAQWINMVMCLWRPQQIIGVNEEPEPGLGKAEPIHHYAVTLQGNISHLPHTSPNSECLGSTSWTPADRWDLASPHCCVPDAQGALSSVIWSKTNKEDIRHKWELKGVGEPPSSPFQTVSKTLLTETKGRGHTGSEIPRKIPTGIFCQHRHNILCTLSLGSWNPSFSQWPGFYFYLVRKTPMNVHCACSARVDPLTTSGGNAT